MARNVTIKDIEKSILDDLVTLHRYIPILVPENETDEKILQIGRSMLDQMIKDMQTGKSDDVLDMQKLLEDWDDVSQKITHTYSKTVADFSSEVTEYYEQED